MRFSIKISVWALLFIFLGACSTTQVRTKDGQSLAEVHTQLGLEYMREGMYEASLENFKKALQADQKLPAAHTSIALLYERIGELSLADTHYAKAYKLKPDDASLLNNYGQFLCRVGRLDEADAIFARAMRDPLYRYPEMVLTNAGICKEKRPDMEAAEAFYRQALDKNPRYEPALRQMARISFSQGHYLAARAYLQRLQELAQLPAEFLWIAVRAEHELGDHDTASSYALLLKNRFPESKQAQALQEWERQRRER